MSYKNVTSKVAVIKAIEECDDLTREEFLRKYGFGKARNYFLIFNGRAYDSKAIVAAAHGFQYLEAGPLKSDDFSGGDRTVKPKLEELGFKIEYIPSEETYLVITENDKSQYDDKTGLSYQFPKKYLRWFKPGVKLIYYKGKMKDSAFSNKRLSLDPHYFGVAMAGEVKQDPASERGYYIVEIVDYVPFSESVIAKSGSGYLEKIPKARETNYWMDGVRQIDHEVYDKILKQAGETFETTDRFQGLPESLESFEEGAKKKVYSSRYERSPQLRQQAVSIHGYSCQACGFDFKRVYGERGAGYIQVHHIKPLSEVDETHYPNPRTDFATLCANCHAVVHRKRSKTLSLEELKSLIDKNKKN